MNKKPTCSACGRCCVRLGSEIRMTSSDFRRWKREGREDILKYAFIPRGRRDTGYLWFDPVNHLEMDRCPFLKESGEGRFACGIQETKPGICKKFWCAWTYGEGEKAAPFKVAAGWTYLAQSKGYGIRDRLRATAPGAAGRG